jgi:hypothetical protein
MPRPPRPPAPFQLTTPATPMSLNVKHSTMLVLYAIGGLVWMGTVIGM